MTNEKNSNDQMDRSRNEELEKNRNTTLQDPGAPVNDYGRASEGLMEQQQDERNAEGGFEEKKER